MELVADPRLLRRRCDEARARGLRVGLVPTMGYLHDGHMALVRRAKALADVVIVSIFVNPTQFGPGEDLDRYPRDPEGDLARCLHEGTDLVFMPETPTLYPPGFQTFVTVEALSRPLCGASRPVHFRGVATIVTKLFSIVGPCVAVFGRKDYQQLQVIRRLVLDLDLSVEVVGHPTVREPDGLAMSSRNAYLTVTERRSATCLYRALQAIDDEVRQRGGMPAAQALALARGLIEAEPGTRIDYLEARDAETLEPVEQLGVSRTVVAMAVFLGRARLIDNRVFGDDA